MATEIEWAWLAGLLEGEGCFTLRKSKKGTPRWPMIQLGMNDADVVKHAMEIAGVGQAREEERVRAGVSKTFYKWDVTRSEDAVMVMRRILPYMGERRSERIHECIKTFESLTDYGEKNFRTQTHCVRGHDFSIPGNVYIRPGDGKRRCQVCIVMRREGVI